MPGHTHAAVVVLNAIFRGYYQNKKIMHYLIRREHILVYHLKQKFYFT